MIHCAIADIFQMIEVMEGGGVFWYAHQRAYCSALKSWPSYINAAIDMFFTKETLAASRAMGKEKKSKNEAGHQPLNAAIIQSLIGELHFMHFILLCFEISNFGF